MGLRRIGKEQLAARFIQTLRQGSAGTLAALGTSQRKRLSGRYANLRLVIAGFDDAPHPHGVLGRSRRPKIGAKHRVQCDRPADQSQTTERHKHLAPPLTPAVRAQRYVGARREYCAEIGVLDHWSLSGHRLTRSAPRTAAPHAQRFLVSYAPRKVLVTRPGLFNGMEFRTGIGYDLHRFAKGRALVLGGVPIEHDRGLLGHSDGDIVLHALCDALLGAAALGDIGELFPDTDPAHKNADSRRFVTRVLERIRSAGWRVGNVDLIIHAETPKLTPYKDRIRQTIADLLDIPISAVGLKATTNEGLDAIGRGEAMACWATALLEAAGAADGRPQTGTV